MTVIQKTLIIVKPEAVRRGNVQDILQMINRLDNIKVIHTESKKLSHSIVEHHYAEHRDKVFFDSTVDFMTSGNVVISIVQGPDAIARVRALAGATNPADAKEGTIRKIYGTDIGRNAIHTSDSIQSAQRELQLFFPEYVRQAEIA